MVAGPLPGKLRSRFIPVPPRVCLIESASPAGMVSPSPSATRPSFLTTTTSDPRNGTPSNVRPASVATSPSSFRSPASKDRARSASPSWFRSFNRELVDRRDFLAPRVYTPLDSKSYRASIDPAMMAVMEPDTTDVMVGVEHAIAGNDSVTAERELTAARGQTLQPCSHLRARGERARLPIPRGEKRGTSPPHVSPEHAGVRRTRSTVSGGPAQRDIGRPRSTPIGSLWPWTLTSSHGPGIEATAFAEATALKFASTIATRAGPLVYLA